MNLKNSLIYISFLGLILGVDISSASAQSPFQTPYTPYSGAGGLAQNRPVFSPYLNLLRRNNSPVLNYYGLVRPELSAINNFNAVQNQFSIQNQTINEAVSGELPTTGRSVSFMNYGGYFGSLQGGRGSSFLQVGGGTQSSLLGTNSFSSGFGSSPFQSGGFTPAPRGPRR